MEILWSIISVALHSIETPAASMADRASLSHQISGHLRRRATVAAYLSCGPALRGLPSPRTIRQSQRVRPVPCDVPTRLDGLIPHVTVRTTRSSRRRSERACLQATGTCRNIQFSGQWPCAATYPHLILCTILILSVGAGAGALERSCVYMPCRSGISGIVGRRRR